MEKNKILLWIILFILIILLFSVIFIVVKEKNKNDKNYEQEQYTPIINILKEKQNWYFSKGLYYATDGSINKYDSNGMSFKFYNDYLERCTNIKCEKFNYVLHDKQLTIKNDLYKEQYNIKYENEELILEEKWDSGSRIVYYFNTPLG